MRGTDGFGLLARIKFSRIMFWSRDGKKYRDLKKRLTRAKARRKVADNTLKVLQAKTKSQEKILKVKRKELENSEKNIRKIWKVSEEEIKIIKEIRRDQEKQNIQEEIKKKIENIQKDEIEEIKENNKKKETKTKENEKNSKKKERKENNKKKETKTKTKENEKNSKKKESKTSNKDEKNKTFRDDLSEKVIFGTNTTVDRTIIEEIQRKIIENKNADIKVVETVKGLTPEEFMAWYGCLENIKNGNEKEPYSKALEMVNSSKDNKNAQKSLYAKNGLKSFEKYLEGSEDVDVGKLGKVDRALYELAKQYKVIEKTREEEALNEKEQQKEENQESRVG